MHKVPTLQQYLLSELKDHPDRIDLAMIMADMATIGKLISSQTNRAGLTSLLGKADSQNVQDEEQAHLDIYANNVCKEYLGETGHFAALASEEEDSIVDLENPDGKYVIAFDPLDGSSNIDVNASIGTIFSVHRKREDIATSDPAQFFQTAREQVLCGYVLYGASTMILFSWGDGLVECTLDQDIGEFFINGLNLQIPEKASYYAMNEAYVSEMSERVQSYLEEVKKIVPKQRWFSCICADFQRNLKGGGIYLNAARVTPDGTKKPPNIRLNYEAKILAYLANQAGGLSIDTDENDIMDLVPTELHQRTSIIFGSKEIVQMYKDTG